MLVLLLPCLICKCVEEPLSYITYYQVMYSCCDPTKVESVASIEF